MKRKIFRNMVYIALSAVLMTTILLSLLTYHRYVEQVKEGIRDEASYLAVSMNQKKKQDLSIYKDITISRITWVAEDGKVLYDSEEQEKHMANHKKRTEIKKALQSGFGEDTRISPTLNKQTYYYAVRLDDGSVLRLSREMQTIFKQAEGTIPLMVVMVVMVIILAVLVSKISTKRIVEPINEIDLIHPKQNQTYGELSPLLDRIEKQNTDIKNQIEEIRAAENTRKEFSANVSHELKTPLTTISGYAELMKDGIVKPEDMGRFSAVIYEEARRLIEMIEDIMKLSKLDENQVGLEKTSVDLYELAFQIKRDLSMKSLEENVSVHIRGIHAKVQGVYQILYEMLFNICENAIKYNQPDGRVEITIISMDDQAAMIVEDTGIGIPKEDMERVFERFYRVDKSHSNQKKGSGLGLSIVKHGVEYHHAEVNLESELGKGTKITITFPKEEEIS